jgi:branched-chain amino acid transport system permease protein
MSTTQQRLVRYGAAVLVAVIAWLIPYQLDGYTMQIVDVSLVFAVIAIGQGLVMGIAGQINLAQIALFGVGAYATAIFTTHSGLGFWPAAVLGVVAATLLGLIVGLPALRVQSHYLGIVTLGLALAFTSWTTNSALAGGDSGISGVPAPPLFGIDLTDDYFYYYLELIVFAVALVFGLFVVRTALGRRLRAMRADPLAAASIGAHISVLRMLVFAVAGTYGGIAGALYAGLIHFVSPQTFSITDMFLLLAMVVIGGRQSLWGCVVGAIGLSLVRDAFTDLSTYSQLAYGTLVVLMVVFAPTGLAGLPIRFRRALDKRRLRHVAAPAVRPIRLSTQEPATHRGARLEVRGIGKRFKGLVALDDVSLDIEPGEIRGIVGPNGSGKSTLFNVISGQYRPTKGAALIDGATVTGRRPDMLSRQGIGRTFQNLRLFRALTVRENILVGLDRSRTRASWRYMLWPVGVGLRERHLGRDADRLLDDFGLTEFASAIPGTLPYGIQRRVEIARAMACQPSLLLLDEPAAGLNGEEKGQLAAIVRAIRSAGVTVVLIEHDMSLVMSLCDRVTVMATGLVIAEGRPTEVVDEPAVIEAYLGQQTRVTTNGEEAP